MLEHIYEKTTTALCYAKIDHNKQKRSLLTANRSAGRWVSSVHYTTSRNPSEDWIICRHALRVLCSMNSRSQTVEAQVVRPSRSPRRNTGASSVGASDSTSSRCDNRNPPAGCVCLSTTTCGLRRLRLYRSRYNSICLLRGSTVATADILQSFPSG